MGQNQITITELILLQLYLGSITFVTGLLVESIFLVAYRKMRLDSPSLWLVLLGNFVITFALSMVIWRVWPFHFDVMFAFINLPALLALMVVLPLVIVLFRRRTRAA